MKNMLHAQKLPLVLSFALIAGIATQASAQTTVFSDNFDDNNRNGWYIFNGGDPIERSLDTTGGDMETVSSGFAIWGALSNFSSVTLANEFDFINLTLDYTVIENIAARNMTFGLYDSGDTTITADQSGLTNVTDEAGYASYLQNDEIRLLYTVAGLGNVNGTANTKKSYGAGDNPFSFIGSYTYTLRAEVNAAGNIVTTQTYNAGEANEVSQTATTLGGTNLFTFDTIAIQGIDSDFSIDNVLVTTNVPEPSTYALLAGMLALTSVMVRRRG